MPPKLGVNNPFDFPASDITPELYQCREPFVNIVRRVDLENLEEYKLHESGMDEEVMKVLMGVSSYSSIFAELLADEFRTEGHLRPFHVQIMAAPALFARLTQEEWHKLGKVWKLGAETKVQVRNLAKSCIRKSSGNKLDPEPPEDKCRRGMSLEFSLPEESGSGGGRESMSPSPSGGGRESMSPSPSGGESGTSSSDTDCSGYLYEHEATAKDSIGKRDKFRGDIFLFNQIENPLGEEEKVLQASIECKEKPSDLDTALFQAATSSRAGIIRNVSKGYGQPVHMISEAESQWLGGVLVLKGVVKISQREADSVITDTDYEEYEKTFKVTGYQPVEQRGNKRVTNRQLKLAKDNRKNDLRQLLEDGLGRLRKMCSSDPTITYPCREYIVGTLYLPKETKTSRGQLPSSEHDSLDSKGARNLLAGLMRIICGDSVRSWNRDRIILARTLRIEYLFAVGKIGEVHMEVNSELALHHRNLQRCREDFKGQMSMVSEEKRILDAGRMRALKSLANDTERRDVSLHCFAEAVGSAFEFLNSAARYGADPEEAWSELLEKFPTEELKLKSILQPRPLIESDPHSEPQSSTFLREVPLSLQEAPVGQHDAQYKRYKRSRTG